MKTTFKAGSGEKMQYLVHSFNDNTIRFIFSYDGIIDPDILSDAVEAVVQSLPILHSTLNIGTFRMYWQENTDLLQSSYYRHLCVSDDPMETALRLSTQPIHPSDLCQLHCTLVQNSTASALMFRISHLCVDGGDAKYLLRKVIEAYHQLLLHQTLDLQVKNGSRAPEQAYQHFSLKELLSLCKLPMGRIQSSYSFPTEETGAPRVVCRMIPASTMKPALAKAKQLHATANDLLMTACYYACAPVSYELSGKSGLGISCTMDLRRHCKGGDTTGICNLSGLLPTALKNGLCPTFSESLTEIARQTSEVKRSPYGGMDGIPLMHTFVKTCPPVLQAPITGRFYSKMPIGLTNLGNCHASDYVIDSLMPREMIFGGPLKRKPGMQISAVSLDSVCALVVYGEYSEGDAQQLQNTLDSVAAQIAQFAQND